MTCRITWIICFRPTTATPQFDWRTVCDVVAPNEDLLRFYVFVFSTTLDLLLDSIRSIQMKLPKKQTTLKAWLQQHRHYTCLEIKYYGIVRVFFHHRYCIINFSRHIAVETRIYVFINGLTTTPFVVVGDWFYLIVRNLTIKLDTIHRWWTYVQTKPPKKPNNRRSYWRNCNISSYSIANEWAAQ